MEFKTILQPTDKQNMISLSVPEVLAQAACVRHACLRAPCIAWPLLSPTFALSLFLSPSFAFDPLRGISHERNNFSPNILAKLEDICRKKKKMGKFYFFTKKTDFSDVLSAFYGQRSVRAAWATRSPWSIYFC